MAGKLEILSVSFYCGVCGMRQDTIPGPHMKRCGDYNGIMDTRIEGPAVYINRAPGIRQSPSKKSIVEVEYKQRGPLSTPGWLDRIGKPA